MFPFHPLAHQATTNRTSRMTTTQKKKVSFHVPALDDELVQLLARTLRNASEVRQNSAVPKATYQSTLPAYVPIRPAADARTLRCWFNVRDHVARNGGSEIFGWALWRRHDGHYQAIHHAVWRTHDGILLDVTPSEIKDLSQILFMADSRVPFDYEHRRFPASLLLLSDSSQHDVHAAWIGKDDQIYPEFGLLRPQFDAD